MARGVSISIDPAALQRLNEQVERAARERLGQSTASCFEDIARSFATLGAAASVATGSLSEFSRGVIEAARQAEEEMYRQRILEASRIEAGNRAHELLLSCLTPAQQEELRDLNYFTVKVPSGNRYQIRYLYTYNVVGLDDTGQPLFELCAGLVEEVPLEDQMLVQKLMLETDELEFVMAANVRHLKPSQASPLPALPTSDVPSY